MRANVVRCLCAATALAVPVWGAQSQAGRETSAQSRGDSARADSAPRLNAVEVSVTRTRGALANVPWAIGVQRRGDVGGAQATLGVDEALNNVPGVMVSNRYNYALDQRLSIRGAGSRANFGTRGVKVLLDGVPQSLPDGQSQLTNIELATIGRVEVLRGAASSLYGNGSGGVISFESDLSTAERARVDARYEGGSYGLSKWQGRFSGHAGHALGMLSASRTLFDGFRQHSGADARQINSAVDVAVTSTSVLQLRLHDARIPRALNPGALTEVEWVANPDSAAAANLARGASRAVNQRQYSIGWMGLAPFETRGRVVAYRIERSVDNPLATPPPAPAGFRNGTYVLIDRGVTGLRLDLARSLGAAERAPTLTAGADFQRARDARENWRTTDGMRATATDTLLLDQVETVTAVGAFANVTWSARPRLFLSGGLRRDEHTFRVNDRFLGDGDDDSGDRRMGAWSGHLGVSFAASDAFAPYANVATAFETPTTTELNARSDGTGGFNSELGPQRLRTIEAGARGMWRRVAYEAALFRTSADSAIIQYQEITGRAYFRNAGSTRSTGAEFGVRANVHRHLEARVAYTYADYTFDAYRVQRGAVTDTLDGNRLAGVPRSFVRAGLRAGPRVLTVDADWTWSDWLYADDLNQIRVGDWGRGRLDMRAAWETSVAGRRFVPFVAVNNVFDQVYVGAITLNGAFGRVRESAPRRNWYAGFELGWSILQ